MRKGFSAAALGLSVFAMLATTAGAVSAASASTSTGSDTCTAVNGPAALNDIPATADCGEAAPAASSGLQDESLSANFTGVAPTTVISSTPLTFSHTNGDILAITKVNGVANELAIGGNFSAVIEANGTSVPANNFAVVNETTGDVAFSSSGGPTNSVTATDTYVRAITSLNGVIYVGGDFDTWDGTARSHVAAIDTTFALTSWNPGSTGEVRALATDGSAIYIGGTSGAVTAVDTSVGSGLWTKYISGGSVHALLATNGALYVGGLFETYDGVTQHGLVEVTPSTGAMITAFAPVLRADSDSSATTGHGAYDGEDPIALSIGPNPSEILVGCGGNAPPHEASNETILMNATTGGRVWSFSTIGDSQAVGSVGDTAVAGYHNSINNTTSAPYYSAQLEDSNGKLTTWDPQITGQAPGGNADAGNGGVQAMYVDQTTDTLYLGGGFIQWAGMNPLTHASLIAFTFTPPSASVPDAPTIGTATAGDSTANLTWTTPLNNGGAPVTDYLVTTSPAIPGSPIDVGNTVTQTTIAGLTDGTAYTFKVAAVNSVGTGANSASSNSVTPTAAPAATVPNAPTIGTATAGDTTAGLTWTAPLNDGGAPITDYLVTPSPALAGSPIDVGSTATQTTITGLTDGTTYTFKVAAVNSVGTGAKSAASNAVTPTASTGGGTSGGGTSGGGGGGAVAVAATAPVRIAGADRFATADAALTAEFPTAGSAGAVVLATSTNYPDALIGTALAAAKNAPLLFVDGSLSADTQADIVRVLPAGGTVYLLGGTAAIPATVATALTNLGFVVTRYAGTDRYGTALAVAAGLGNPGTVFLATGTNFPDALTAGPAAAHLHGVVLLTNGTSLPATVKTYLTAHPGTVYAVGSPAAAADPSATPLTGTDRYATAVAVDTSVFAGGPSTLGVASGLQFPDALSGGVYQAHFGGAMVLSDPNTLPTSTSTYLTSVKGTVTRSAIFGGTTALSASVQTAIDTALGF